MLFAFLLATSAYTQSIIGQILADDIAVSNASVSVAGTDVNTTSNEQGQFRIDGLAPGRYELWIQHIRFEPYTELIQLSSAKDLLLEVALVPASYELEEISVTTISPLETGFITRITEEETRRYPGTFFDPARFASSFPGAQVANDQANQLSIRGLHPDMMQWHLEGLEILNPNHLANAGTLADRPTQSGGGVTMLSNQVLQNSSLIYATEPGRYGNAMSGIMDIHFRPGNKEKREYTVQAGLLGLEGAAEGPFKRGGEASYLVNYRYSTVGLITALGVDFGDEKIQFQDLSAVMNFPTRMGAVKVFGFGGLSSNDHDPIEQSEWQEDGDFKNVRYDAGGGTIGAVWNTQVGEGNSLKIAAAFSGNYYDRSEEWPDAINGEFRSADEGSRSKLSALFAYSGTVLTDGIVRLSVSFVNDWVDVTGTNGINEDLNFRIEGSNVYVRPHFNFVKPFGRGFTLTAGAGLSFFDNSLRSDGTSLFLEPEVKLDWKINARHAISLSGRLGSQVLSDVVLAYRENFPAGQFQDPMRTANAQLSYSTSLWNGVLQIAGFYHYLYDLPHSQVDQLTDFSVLNLNAYPINFLVFDNGNASTAGGSIGYRRNMQKGFYTAVNASIFGIEYQPASGLDTYKPTFATQYTAYLGGGKEWTRDRDYGLRTWGLSLGLVSHSGLRSGEIDEDASQQAYRTVYVPGTYGDVQTGTYFRVDTRVYFRKDKESHASTWSLDIQNLFNIENEWLPKYDFLLNEVRVPTQLGIVPVLSYRIDF